MNDEDQIPGAEAPPSNALQLRDPNTPPEAITPAQARVEAVSEALKTAYANASKLTVSADEAKALAEDFPDDAFRLGAGGDINLIYIEHAYLRQRLNQVLGVGAAVPIRRREWAEEFTYWKDNQTKKGVRVYVDMVLLVRGCVVGEAIGDSVYYPDNAKTNYSDALESAKSNAFRRCCKEFGVGLQAWMKGWCEAWKGRQRSGGSQGSAPAPKPAPAASQTAKPPARTADLIPAEADRDQRFRFLAALSDVKTSALGYFTHKGWIGENDTLDALPNKHVPTTKGQYDHLMAEIEAFGTRPPAGQEEEWRNFKMPWGRQKDIPLAELDKKYLYGLWANWGVEYEYNGQRKSDDAIAKDEKFRQMLDDAGKHYDFKE